MHHKRGRRKNARAGCLACKAHKANGMKGKLCDQTRQEQAARLSEKEQRNDHGSSK
jgi:hypothetical protein